MLNQPTQFPSVKVPCIISIYQDRNAVELFQAVHYTQAENTNIKTCSMQCAVCSMQYAVCSMQQAVGSRQQAVGSRQQAVGSRQQAVGSRQQAVGSTQYAVRSTQYAVCSGISFLIKSFHFKKIMLGLCFKMFQHNKQYLGIISWCVNY